MEVPLAARARWGAGPGGHRRARLAPENSLADEWSTASRRCGTLRRHFLWTDPVAAPVAVAALALGMTVPTASRVLIPASRRAQRFTPSEVAATRPAVLLAPSTARADEHLASAPGAQKQPGIVHRSPRRGGLDDPQSPGNTALGAVRTCGSGRSLGRDRQVNAVRGCAGLLAESDLTPPPEPRHRRRARCPRPVTDRFGSATKQRHVPSASVGGIQCMLGGSSMITSTPMSTIYPHFSVAMNTWAGVRRARRTVGSVRREGHRCERGALRGEPVAASPKTPVMGEGGRPVDLWTSPSDRREPYGPCGRDRGQRIRVAHRLAHPLAPLAHKLHRTNHQRSGEEKPEFQRTSTPVTGNGYDRPEGITSQSRYTLFRPSDCPNNPDHLTEHCCRGSLPRLPLCASLP